ncbi:MAG: CAP domain-containing protein [Caldilineaceae bacterium]
MNRVLILLTGAALVVTLLVFWLWPPSPNPLPEKAIVTQSLPPSSSPLTPTPSSSTLLSSSPHSRQSHSVTPISPTSTPSPQFHLTESSPNDNRSQRQPTAASTPTPQPTAAPNAQQALQSLLDFERTLIVLVNQQRELHGLQPLLDVPLLNLAAHLHSLDMAQQYMPWHLGSDGSRGGQRMLAVGYHWRIWSEIIGWGFPTPAAMVDWWLSDAEHRAVLLSDQFTEFGVGYVDIADSPWQHYWTVNFGRPAATGTEANQATILPTTPTATPLALAVHSPAQPCSVTSQQDYDLIPMEAVDLSHPASLHGDLNLAQRSYRPVGGLRALININGPTDADAPQLRNILGNPAATRITSLYQVYDWDWTCEVHGCQGAPLQQPEVSLIGIRTQPGALLYPPTRRATIYGAAYLTAVLYAEPTRITLAYTRDGFVAHGYTVHMEQLCVDPTLVALYQQAENAGRWQLPAIRREQPVGTAYGAEVLVAIRDRGAFLDPRSRKDWWQGS